ncbi:MAG: LptF/LptG family permease [Rhabdochlamydiaceae bacterium]|nr:LptF/LptG family permease [Rhabdochlamydiaceae bacterium]
MPILWRYLLRSFFQVFLLCVSSFIAVLVVLRFQEIARFASSGAPLLKVFSFTLLQIPYILPIAIPVSCLIASILLFQRLSHTHELTALRTCGLGLKPIIFPMLYAGCLMGLIALTISCEIAPRCRSLSKWLIYETASQNPLFLLQKESLVKLKNAYYDMKVLESGKYAEDVLIAVKNSTNQRLALLIAKELSLKGELLKGEQVALISSVDPKKALGFDHLVIENQAIMDTEAANLSQFTQSTDWNSSYEYQPMRMILARENLSKKHSKLFSLSRSAQLELSRRISIAIAAFTFTLIGTAFGMQISRNRSRKGILWAIALAAFYMVCFVAAKSMRHNPLLASMIYLLPHPMIILLCLRSLKSIQEGVE